MKMIIPLALIALAAATQAVAAERRYAVTDFDRILVEGPYQVSLTTGLSSGARAIGSSAALERVTVEVQGRTLRIRNNRAAWGGYPGDRPGPVIIEATTRTLAAAAVSGSGTLTVDRARGLRVDLSVSGSGRIALAKAEADTLVVGLLGSGRIVVAGQAKQLRATIQGSGDFDGRALRTDDAQIAADTAGAVTVGVTRSAKVNAIGPGDVEVIGSPACTVSGAAAMQVKCGKPR